MREWQIHEAYQHDLPAINRLYSEVFNVSRPEEHEVWKFWNNPVSKPLIVVAKCADEIVGQYALLPTNLKIKNEIVLGAQSLDTMTHPKFRGQGMFIALAEACYELARTRGVEILYGFPNESSYPGFVGKLKWSHIGGIPLLSRPIKPSMSGRFPKVLSWPLDLIAKSLPCSSSNSNTLEYRTPTTEELSKVLGGDSQKSDKYEIFGTPEWYLWRFSKNWGRSYEWFIARTESDISGVGVCGLTPYGSATFSLAMATNSDGFKALMNAAIHWAHSKNASSLHIVTNEIQKNSILKKSAFFKRSALPMIVRSLSSKTIGSDINNIENWSISSVSIDTF